VLTGPMLPPMLENGRSRLRGAYDNGRLDMVHNTSVRIGQVLLGACEQ
jgi:hypothetical protein